MCILFIFINPDPKPGEYKVIMASNRDAVIERPAKPAHAWKSHKGCYGGKHDNSWILKSVFKLMVYKMSTINF